VFTSPFKLSVPQKIGSKSHKNFIYIQGGGQRDIEESTIFFVRSCFILFLQPNIEAFKLQYIAETKVKLTNLTIVGIHSEG